MKQPTTNIIYFVLIYAVFWSADLIKNSNKSREPSTCGQLLISKINTLSNDQFSIGNPGVINFEYGLVL